MQRLSAKRQKKIKCLVFVIDTQEMCRQKFQNVCCLYTGCFKKSFTTLKAYGNIQYHVHERDFFLWGFVKYRVFVLPLPANVVELRTRITARDAT